MATLDQAITAMQGYIQALSGVKAAPTEPPEQINQFPFAVAYASSGSWTEEPAGMKKGLHEIVLELHVARKDLPSDYDLAIPYVDSIPNTLFSNLSDKWDGTIDTFGSIQYEFGELGWGGIPTMGIRFTIQAVKIQTAVT